MVLAKHTTVIVSGSCGELAGLGETVGRKDCLKTIVGGRRSMVGYLLRHSSWFITLFEGLLETFEG